MSLPASSTFLVTPFSRRCSFWQQVLLTIHNIGTRDMMAMGGVGKKMPFVQAVFAIGALALAGIPILNGFWSKELILEKGLQQGPFWLYVIMVIVAGLTALYTARCFWLVFRGESGHAHKTDLAMKIALVLLAIPGFMAGCGPFFGVIRAIFAIPRNRTFSAERTVA